MCKNQKKKKERINLKNGTAIEIIIFKYYLRLSMSDHEYDFFNKIL